MADFSLNRRDARLFLVVAVPAAAALHAAVYFPHATPAAQALAGYLALLARASAAILRAFDPEVLAQGTRMSGRFPMEIVLDCAALDVQAFYLAAVLAFPVSWRARAAGAVGGLLAINVANLIRIVTLYLVGVHRPASFHLLHEEVLQLAMIAVGAGSFAAWLRWSRPRRVA